MVNYDWDDSTFLQGGTLNVERLIGIVIPQDFKDDILEFCAQFNPEPMEPYMALASPEMLESIRGVDRKLQSFCLSQPPFKTIIGGPNVERSENGATLYLTVMMGPLNTTRDKLLKHIRIPAGGFYRAQLVLIKDKTGTAFDMMLTKAKEKFPKAREFYVQALAMYSKKDGANNFSIDSEYRFTGR